MRYLTQTAASYVGVDLHARTLYVCVLDHDRPASSSPRNLPAKPEPFLQAVAPFRARPPRRLRVRPLLVLARRHLPRARHPLRPRARLRHQGRPRVQDQVRRPRRRGPSPDSSAAATSRSPTPTPRERRGLRDLLRTRLRLVRQRAELYGHVHTVRRQLNLAPVGSDVKYKSKRDAVAADIADPHTRRGVEARLDPARAARHRDPPPRTRHRSRRRAALPHRTGRAANHPRGRPHHRR